MNAVITQMTADELLLLPQEGFRCELIKGELRKTSPAGSKHGKLIMRLGAPLTLYVAQHNLGAVYGAETGFRIEQNPDTVCAPDIAFISRERVDEIGDIDGFWPGAPDLAVEVLSPNDRSYEVEEKVQDWLRAGTKLVWVVSPKLRAVTVYSADGSAAILRDTDVLEGGNVVQGFRCHLSELFS
jgi:Uma2 family endonuclease